MSDDESVCDVLNDDHGNAHEGHSDNANADAGNEWQHRVNRGQELYLEKLKELLSA
jgi:hypothetical protein